MAPDVAVDRLPPSLPGGAKVAAHNGGIDSCVDSGAEERQKATLAVADDSEWLAGPLAVEPIDCRQHLLHLVANDVAAQLIGHAINELAMWLIGVTDSGVARPSILAVDQNRHQNTAAVFRQPAGELRRLRHPRRETGKHLG